MTLLATHVASRRLTQVAGGDRSRKVKRSRITLIAIVLLTFALGACHHEPPETVIPTPLARPPLTPLFNDLQERTFHYFWDTAMPDSGLIPDRYPYDEPFSSIAAIGFGLTAYGIGVERGWITREQARDRVLLTLRYLRNLPQGPQTFGVSGYHGFFYHFLDLHTGRRYGSWVELSSVDTSLLLGGVLFCQSYFDGNDPGETEIRYLANSLYQDVDWPWLQVRKPLISMGWMPDSGFIEHDWEGYNEAMLVYILALGSPTHPVGKNAWTKWTSSYDRAWGKFEKQEYLGFGPQFGHQYSHVWIDFRGIKDAYMRKRGFDYFENSRRATFAQRDYAIANPMGWKDYGENVWGLTASDGPQHTRQPYDGQLRMFRHYSARGAGTTDVFDDGTIAPTAAAGSLPFAPEIVIPAIEHMHTMFDGELYGKYGFLDAFNPSFDYSVPLKTGRVDPKYGWIATDYIGIDEGPIVTMIENYRDDFVWNVMKKNPYIRRGLERAGFTGGWLDQPAPDASAASTGAGTQ